MSHRQQISWLSRPNKTDRLRSMTLPSIRIIGDSITSQNDTVNIGTPASPNTGLTRRPRYWTFFHWMKGSSFHYVSALDPADLKRRGSNSGMGGDDMNEFLNRLSPILASMPESHLFVHIGTNSVNAGRPHDELRDKYIEIIRQITEAGKQPIMTTILPRNAVDGVLDWSTADGVTAADKRKTVLRLNNWLQTYCKERGIICVPWHQAIIDASGNAQTGTTADGLHLSGKGSYLVAKRMLVPYLSHLVPQGVVGHLNPTDVYDAATNPSGNAFNGMFTGTGGTTSDAGGSGTITGPVPDNIRLTKSMATTTSVVSSIVPCSDGMAGNSLQLDFTTYGTGSASESWRVEYWSGSTVNLPNFANVGDLVTFDMQVEIMGGHNGIMRVPLTRISGSNVVKVGSTISFDAATRQIRDAGNNFGVFNGNRMIMVAGAASPANTGIFKVTSVAPGVLQLDVGTILATEAAGAAVTITQPFITAIGGGSSTETIVDENTGILHITGPVAIISSTVNFTPRIEIYTNGLIAGTARLKISRPRLAKLPYAPDLVGYLAHDQV